MSIGTKQILSSVKLQEAGNFGVVVHKNELLYFSKHIGSRTKFGPFDNEGNQLWQYNLNTKSIRHIVSTDADQDGEYEFYIAGLQGLDRIDIHGNCVWSKAGRFIDLDSYAPLERDKKVSIVTCSMSVGPGFFPNRYQIRDDKGNSIHDIKAPKRGISGSIAIDWHNKLGIIAVKHKTVYLLDHRGEVVLKCNVGKEIFGIEADSVQFISDQPAYIFILIRFRSVLNRSWIIVYDSNGHVVYEDAIKSTLAYCKIQNDNARKESILVAERNKIWKYEISELK